MEGVLVTGTDTGVGKTVVSAALLKGALAAGRRVTYVKPAQTGLSEDPGDAAVVAALTGAPTVQGVGLDEPLAPAVAAERAGVRLTRADLLAPFSGVDGAIVGEGAGGLLVELGTDGTTLADLAADLGLPLVVATRPGLGTLNHTRLTLEAAWARGLTVLGLVVCGHPPPGSELDVATATNVEQLARMAPVLAVIDRLDPLDAGTLPAVAWDVA